MKEDYKDYKAALIKKKKLEEEIDVYCGSEIGRTNMRHSLSKLWMHLIDLIERLEDADT